MGHSSVTTNSNMNLKRVSQDFPTIVARYVKGLKLFGHKNLGHNSITNDLCDVIK